MKKLGLIITLPFVLVFTVINAQSDSSVVLTIDKFMEVVKNHHPLARQADIQLAKGDANLQSSRGGFDPKIYADYNQKYFGDKNYYGLLDGGLKIPTWFGMELKTGIEQNDGVYLNPENNVPDAGLWYAGVSLPVGKGLFIDKRRAELRQAGIYQKSSVIDRQIMLNELLYNAGKAYWDWFSAYHTLEVFEDALVLANVRFTAVKQSTLMGDNPPIDTLEAGIQVQNRKLGLQQAQLDFANASALLEIFLWAEGQIPLELSDGTIPISIENLTAFEAREDYLLTLETLVQNHPKLRRYQNEIDQLALDQRLKKEQLKPEINLNYFALSEPIGMDPFSNLSTNNYKWGLEFNLPILLRKERGEVKIANLKMEEKSLDLSNEQAQIKFQITSSINEWNTTYDQIILYNQTVEDYSGLLEGERRLFEVGESSLFMINSREMGFIQAQLKLIELMAKNIKAMLTTEYYVGNLGSEKSL